MFKYSSRFWLYAPISLFVLVAVAVMIHWQMSAAALEKKLASLKGKEAIPGVTIDWSAVDVGGFPFRLDGRFTNFRVQGAGAHGPFTWAAEKFAFHALTYGRSQTVYEAAGRQQAGWTDTKGGAHSVAFLPGSMRASSILDKEGLRRFDLDIANMGDAAFTITRFQFHMRRDPDGQSLDLMLKADGLKSQSLSAENIQLYTTLSQARALAPLLRGDASWPKATARWRAEGGQAKPSQAMAAGLESDRLLSPLY